MVKSRMAAEKGMQAIGTNNGAGRTISYKKSAGRVRGRKNAIVDFTCVGYRT
jgi:hypothetical protein